MRVAIIASVLVGSMAGLPGARAAAAQPAWDRQAVYAAGRRN